MLERQLHRRLASFYFAYFLMLGGIAPFFSLYLNKLGFSGVQIGVLLALMPLARVVAPPAWAWLADHQGNRRPLVRMTTAAAAVTCAGTVTPLAEPAASAESTRDASSATGRVSEREVKALKQPQREQRLHHEAATERVQREQRRKP